MSHLVSGHAGGPVLAGALGAGVELVLAADAGEAVGAGAVQAGAEVPAHAAVDARATDAPLGGCLAALAVSSARATGICEENMINTLNSTKEIKNRQLTQRILK